jgi:hypothetical protein
MRWSMAGAEDAPLSWDSLQGRFAEVFKTHVRPGDEVPHGPGDEDGAGFGQGSDSRADVDGQPARLSADQLDFANVDASTDLDPDVRRLRGEGQCEIDRRSGRLEGGEEPIAGSVDLAASESAQIRADEGVVALEDAAPLLVAHLRRQLCRAGDVGEHHRCERSRWTGCASKHGRALSGWVASGPSPEVRPENLRRVGVRNLRPRGPGGQAERGSRGQPGRAARKRP